MPSPRAVRRLAAGLLGGTLVATTLTACSKEADGAVAIGRDADGELVVQIVTCEYPASELDLLLEQDGADPYQDLDSTGLEQPVGTSRSYTWAELFGSHPVDSLDRAAPYHLRGTVTDEEGARDMNGVDFILAEVADQPAGTVVSNDLDAPVPVETFTAQACTDDPGASDSDKAS